MVGGNVRISAAMQAGFIDEMEKMAFIKEAAFMQNVGDVIRQTGRRAASYTKGIGVNVGRTLKDMATSPIKSTTRGAASTLKQGLRGGLMGKAMLGLQGYGIYSGVRDLGRSPDEAGGVGRGERLGRLVGGTAGGFAGFRHGISGGIVGQLAGEKALGAVGKGADKLVGMVRRKPAQMQNQIPPGQVQPE